MCEKHYKAWLRQQPKCRAPKCNASLFPDERTTRGDFCRPHEQLALTRRPKADQERSLQRFRNGIEPDWILGCWLWAETPDGGYGKIHAGGPWLAHRFSYVWFFGGHGRRQTLDHLCNRPLCVRPDHLEPVSGTLNTDRRDVRQAADVGAVLYPKHRPRDSTEMDEWASATGLPFGNPPILSGILDAPSQASPPVTRSGCD